MQRVQKRMSSPFVWQHHNMQNRMSNAVHADPATRASVKTSSVFCGNTNAVVFDSDEQIARVARRFSCVIVQHNMRSGILF